MICRSLTGAILLSAIAALSLASVSHGQGPGVLTAGETPNTHTEASLHSDSGAIPKLEESIEALSESVSETEKQLSEEKAELLETEELEETLTTDYLTENYFGFFGKQLSCKKEEVYFSGQAGGTDAELTITPSYGDCFFLGEGHSESLAVTFNLNGCDYIINQPTSAEESHSKWQSTLSLVCQAPEATMELEVYFGPAGEHGGALLCRYAIPEQTGLGPVYLENTAGNPDRLSVNFQIENLSLQHSGLCGSGESNEVEYVSNFNLTSNSHDVWISTE